MSRKKRDSYVWTSYSDLMTSLFFVMLVLFVLTLTQSYTSVKKLNTVRSEIKQREDSLHYIINATEQQIKKIEEIEEALKGIDPVYFDYNTAFKKHILKINVNFPTGESSMDNIDFYTKNKLKEAGRSIIVSLNNISRKYPGIQYLLVIEGQASRDSYIYNYELSYNRALSLSRFWTENNIDFGSNCEVLISGSGTGGTMRDNLESNNQRFLIHLIPKPGIIDISKHSIS